MASIGPHVPAHSLSSDSAIQRPPQADPPRYEEEEEDEDCYVPELPPELAAVRASASGPPRRTMGPARGPLRREEEEEESEDEIGPLPPPPPHAGAGPPNSHEDAVAEFMQKEAQRRQAVEVCQCPPCVGRNRLTHLASQDAARPKTLQREEWMLVPPTSSDLLSSASFLPSYSNPLYVSKNGSAHSAGSIKAEQTPTIFALNRTRQSRRQHALDRDARRKAAASGRRGDGQETSRRERGYHRPGPAGGGGGEQAAEARRGIAAASRRVHGALPNCFDHNTKVNKNKKF